MEGVFAETDGKLQLVGDWQRVYSENPDPWDQAGRKGQMAAYYAVSRTRLVETLGRLGPFNAGIEIGCGHGHLTAMLRAAICPMIGIDISEAAVKTARSLQHDAVFRQGDITADDFGCVSVDFVVLGQCLWYVLHRFDVTLANMLRTLRADGLLVVSQAFLHGEQRYGAEIANGFTGALKLFLASDRLQLIHASYDDSGRLVHRDGLMIFRKVG
ncbi:methyltransferase family protein [Mesorhizobium loti]|uniref:Methyltransferase family protein n=1 Tax=Rhizobium loti TaxID=381 RepID=A0A8E2W849_RHILI|nr:class I SAM-dependent methyltransferase [Mesorhizobium loti]PWJ88381.1 methyltransferase family protein [Mesorhizobium loti]